jgi:hypothetical protein
MSINTITYGNESKEAIRIAFAAHSSAPIEVKGFISAIRAMFN